MQEIDNIVVGRLHVKDGFVIERVKPGTIRLGLAIGGDPFNRHTPVHAIELTDAMFASMVAHVTAEGETGRSFRAALEMISAPAPLVKDVPELLKPVDAAFPAEA